MEVRNENICCVEVEADDLPEWDEEKYCSTVMSSDSCFSDDGHLMINKMFAYRLIFLDQQAWQMQYELAVLSTLGGAYHLCNHPQQALYLAHRLEMLGRRLGSSQLTLKAQGFKAINIGLLGNENLAFKQLKNLRIESQKTDSAEMARFFRALWNWLHTQRKLRHTESKLTLRTT